MVTTVTSGVAPIYEHEYLNNDGQRGCIKALQNPNIPSKNEAYRAQVSLSPNAGRSTSPESQMDKREGEPSRYHDETNTYDVLDEMEGALEDWLKWIEE